jgi:hypothetical protein
VSATNIMIYMYMLKKNEEKHKLVHTINRRYINVSVNFVVYVVDNDKMSYHWYYTGYYDFNSLV